MKTIKIIYGSQERATHCDVVMRHTPNTKLFIYAKTKANGGFHNSVTHNYAGVFGCNVASVMGCALHANTFVAQNMVCIAVGGGLPAIPTGSFYYVNCPGTCCPVFIK